MDGEKYKLRGGIDLQDSSSTQNLGQGTAMDNFPKEFDATTTLIPTIVCGNKNDTSEPHTKNKILAVSARQQTNGEIALRVSALGTPITMGAPSAASVGVASGSIASSSTTRRYILLTNTSANVISIAFTAAAVLNSGITLQPNASYEMSEALGNLSTQSITAIASAAASNLAIQVGT